MPSARHGLFVAIGPIIARTVMSINRSNRSNRSRLSAKPSLHNVSVHIDDYVSAAIRLIIDAATMRQCCAVDNHSRAPARQCCDID